MSEVKWKWNLYASDSWKALLDDIGKAKHSVDFEKYLFFNDQIGRTFLELFIRKAKEGIRVRVILDAIGSRGLIGAPIISELEKAGAQVIFFNPFHLKWFYRYSWWFLRDHRKIVVIDNKIGYTGGVGIADFASSSRDTYVRIEGEVVALMQRAFNRMWLMSSKRKKFFRFTSPKNNNQEFTFLTNAPYPRQRFIYHKFLRSIKGAKKYIYLTTPYFIPTARFFRRLRKQAKMGIDVRLLLPRHTDHSMVDIGSHSYIERALKSGIKIFYDDAETFNHTKTIVIDDEWGTVGSSNLDNLSFLLLYEANLMSTNTEFVSDLKDQFLIDVKKAKQITLGQWQQRPWQEKLKEKITWPFHSLM